MTKAQVISASNHNSHQNCLKLHFYHAMLCIRGTSHDPVSVRPSVRLSVRHKSVFY